MADTIPGIDNRVLAKIDNPRKEFASDCIRSISPKIGFASFKNYGNYQSTSTISR